MKLHKRTIRTVSGHKIIQLMTPTGSILAEFHDDRLYAMFVVPAGVSIYDEDTCQVVGAAAQ